MKRAIFATGIPRSGTSFLAACINWHPDVGPRHPDMDGYETAGHWVEHFYRHAYTKFIENNAEWDFWLSGGGIFGQRPPRLHSAAPNGMGLALVRNIAQPFYLSKSPSHIWRIGALRHAFPDCRFVIIVRPAEQVLGSVYQHHSYLFDGDLLTPTGQRWFEQRYVDTLEHLATLKERDMLFVRYEDLCTETGATLRNVMQHCGLKIHNYGETIVPKDRRKAWRERIPRRYQLAVLAMAARLNTLADRVIDS